MHKVLLSNLKLLVSDNMVQLDQLLTLKSGYPVTLKTKIDIFDIVVWKMLLRLISKTACKKTGQKTICQKVSSRPLVTDPAFSNFAFYKGNPNFWYRWKGTHICPVDGIFGQNISKWDLPKDFGDPWSFHKVYPTTTPHPHHHHYYCWNAQFLDARCKSKNICTTWYIYIYYQKQHGW